MDEIQKKIGDFQKQLLPPQSLLKETILSNPAVLPAIGLIIGLVLQYYFFIPLFIWIFLLIFSLILFLLQKIFGKTLIFISVSLLFICLGSIRLLNYNTPAENDVRNIKIDDFTFAHLKAQIVSEPRVITADENDWFFSKISQSYPYTTFYAKVLEIKTDSGWEKVSGTIKFYISEEANNLNIGDEFQTFCRLEKFSSAENPGQFDTAEYMNRNGVFLSASVKSVNTLKILGSEKTKFLFGIKEKFQELVIAALNGDIEPDNNSRLVEAMLLGSRAKIDKKLYNDFIKTGLVHLIVLSGLNVGILAGCFWWLSKKAGLLHRGRSIACIIATIIFLFAVPAAPSTLRAGIMFLIFCLARLFNRRASLLNSIALSAIILLLIRPIDFLDAGFQLSFLATTGIVLLCPVFYNFLISPFENLKLRFYYLELKMLLAALSTSCTAWISVAPIIAYHFHQLQLLTALWTLPAIVPATIIIVLGTFKVLLSPLLPTLAFGLGIIINFSAKILSYLVTYFAKVPVSHFVIGKFPIFFVIICYLLIFLWKFFPFKKNSKNLIYPASLSLLFITCFSFNKIQNNQSLQLTVLSIGHGQAAFVKTAENNIFIIDAGSMSKNNIGGTIVNPFLDFSGISQIDAIFVSHPDFDHYSGIPEILDSRAIKSIYATSQFKQKTNDANSAISRYNRFRLSNIAPEKIPSDKTLITRLWPAAISDENETSSNESSLVLLFEYAGRKILFCSDIEKPVEQKLMSLYPDLDIDIMITPHHGSGRTNDPVFINYFKPEYLITSCQESRFPSVCQEILNHPHSYFTCNSGAVTAIINSKGKITIETFK